MSEKAKEQQAELEAKHLTEKQEAALKKASEVIQLRINIDNLKKKKGKVYENWKKQLEELDK